MTTPISSTASTASVLESQSSARSPNTTLESDDFLKLLAVQMSNQDPMEPMKDTEFISQMASFTSLEQMKELNAGFSQFSDEQQAIAVQNYLGRTVTAQGESGPFSGTVEAVGRDGNGYYLEIGAARVSPEQVLRVEVTPPPSEG